MPHLAHVAQPIEHQSRTFETILGFAGMVVGTIVVSIAGGVAAAGAVVLSATGVGLVVAVALCVVAISAASGTISNYMDMGKFVGKAFDGDSKAIEGAIVTGARTVFVGADIRAAANASANTRVDCHRAPAHVSQGSATVHIEGHNASRKGDGTSCDGAIARGCESVEVGGRKVGDTGKDPGDSWYQLLTKTQEPLDFISTWIPGGGTVKSIVTWVAGMVAELTDNKEAKERLARLGAKDGLKDALKKTFGDPGPNSPMERL